MECAVIGVKKEEVLAKPEVPLPANNCLPHSFEVASTISPLLQGNLSINPIRGYFIFICLFK